MNLVPELARDADELAIWRQDLHAHPELAFEEHRTAGIVADRLRSFGLEPEIGVGGTGVVAVIEGAAPGPTIALRADIDALPMRDESGRAYASRIEGRAHTCGHDGHTVALLGVARNLAKFPPATGKVVLLFQPAEENVQGAQAMIAAGVLDRHSVDEIYAFHNMPLFASGQACVLTGPTLNGALLWEIQIEGVGGHGAAFYKTVDPLQAAARLAVEIPSIIGRHIDPAETALITVGKLQAGTAANIIPGTAVLSGTLRGLSGAVMDELYRRLEQVAAGIAAMTGCTITCSAPMRVPPCINANEQAQVAARACAAVLGDKNVVREARPLAFTDDFAHFLNAVPGAYLFLGQDSEMCHHASFDFDDKLLSVAGSVFVNIVRQRLG